jgi:streptomycin 6-kinase
VSPPGGGWSDAQLPENLVAAATDREHRQWLDRLGKTVEELSLRWSLQVGPPFQPGGQTSWVAPAKDSTGTSLVLKVVWRHHEAEHEADGLAIWAGNGTVLLRDAAAVDDQTAALLLERCLPGTPLSTLTEDEQDQVIAGLLVRLWREPPSGHRLRPLSEMCGQWADEFERVADQSPLDQALVGKAMNLFRRLPGSAEREVMLCTDLHAENVLAAGREPWLVIDPKPYVGDPTYDILQHVINCQDRLLADPDGLLGRLTSLTGLDTERARLWLFARCVQESPGQPWLAEVARKLKPDGT